MKKFIVDTNILYSGLWTTNLLTLKHLVDKGAVKLYVAEMVKREKISKTQHEVENAARNALSEIKKIHQKGIKLKELTTSLSSAELILNEIYRDSERLAVEDFEKWKNEFMVEVVTFDSSRFTDVIDDYFAGDGAYKEKKERQDFPDSIIHHTILKLRDSVGEISAVVGDRNLNKVLSKEDNITVYDSLSSVFEVKEFKDNLVNYELKPYFLSEGFSQFIQRHIRGNPGTLLEGYTEEISNLYMLDNFSFHAGIDIPSVDSIENLAIREVFDIGGDVFSAKITFSCDALLTYVTDYSNFLRLDEQEDKDIQLDNMNSDGMCEISEMIYAKFDGEVTFSFEEPKDIEDIQRISDNPSTAKDSISLEFLVQSGSISSSL